MLTPQVRELHHVADDADGGHDMDHRPEGAGVNVLGLVVLEDAPRGDAVLTLEGGEIRRVRSRHAAKRAQRLEWRQREDSSEFLLLRQVRLC